MTSLRDAAQQALEALEPMQNNRDDTAIQRAITALRAALEQQEQEPVASAWIRDGVMVNAFPWPPGDPRGRDEDQYWQRKGYTASPLYTAPPRREWRSLSEEEIDDLSRTMVKGHKSVNWLTRAIEAGLKEKNQ